MQVFNLYLCRPKYAKLNADNGAVEEEVEMSLYEKN